MGCRWRNAVRFQFFQEFYAILLLLSAVRNCWSLNSEGMAMLAFRECVHMDPYNAFSNWNPFDEDPCKWRGVSCVDGKVISLELVDLSLQGNLAPELGQLLHLQKLALGQNNFSGSIPKELGELGNLELLNLSHNGLVGKIPSNLGNMSTLKSLLLTDNKLEGSIPPELGNLISLCELQLDRNQMSGFIPGFDPRNRKTGKSVSLCGLKNLKKADFSFNYFQGEIPSCLDHLPWSSFQWNCFQDQISEYHFQLRCGNGGLHLYQADQREAAKKARTLLQADNISAHPGQNFQALKTSPHHSPSPSPSPSHSHSHSHSPSPTPSLSPSPSPSPVTSPTPSPVSSPKRSPHSSSTTNSTNSSPKHSSVHSVSVPSVLSTPDAQTFNPSKNSSAWKYYIAVAAVAVFLVTSVLFYICRRRNVVTIRPWKTGISGQLQKVFVTGVPKLNRVDLEAALEDFSNVIGSTPDSMLFKGTLSNGVEIAVTSTIISSTKDWSEHSELYFRKKIEVLGRINHKNFINLLGFCEEEEPFQRMMVFEYAPNGTLFEHLHNKGAEHLDWATRMRIIMGITYCLQYMHHEMEPPVIHPNLHSSAVYLTDDYAAKLSDPDVWKEAAIKSNQMKSSSRTGNLISYGDMRLSDMELEVANNVYCFGLLLLEIISGKLPYAQEQGLLIEWAMGYLDKKDMIQYMVDPSLKSFKYNELEKICEVVQSCICPYAEQRLSMRDITSEFRVALSISPEAAYPKLSPLWWAELEILSQDGS